MPAKFSYLSENSTMDGNVAARVLQSVSITISVCFSLVATLREKGDAEPLRKEKLITRLKKRLGISTLNYTKILLKTNQR